jgi:hypothetical protein
MPGMSELERSGSRLPRSAREQRAYRLALATGALAVVAVVGFILAIAGVIGAGIPIIAALLAVVGVVLFRRIVRS